MREGVGKPVKENLNKGFYSVLITSLLFFFILLLSGAAYAQTISSITPTCATLNQSFNLTINSASGDFNKNDARVILNDDQNNLLQILSLSATQIVANVPAARLTQVGTVTVKVGNKNGPVYTWSNPVTFTVLTTPAVTPATRCGAGIVTLSASGTPAGGNYNWYTTTTGGTPINTGATYSPSVSANTTYYVSMVSGGCESARTAVTATVNPIPVNPVVTSASRCGPGSVTLTASGAPTGATYQWYTSAGAIISGASSASYTTPSLASTTTYNVSVVSSANCESGKVAVTATINPIPDAPTVNSDVICRGGQVNLSASGAPAGGNYNWYTTTTGGTPINTGATYSPTISTSTDYFVATVSAEGCESTTRTKVTGRVIPVPVASVSANGSPTTFCEGSSVTLSAVANPSSPATGSYTYQWKKDGTDISGATGATYTANASGNYSVIIFNEGCPSDESGAMAVTVHPFPEATVTAPNGLEACQGSVVTLNVSAVAGATYQWQLNGNNVPSATGSTYNATASGNYTVVVTQNNCPTTSSPVAVIINTPPTATITGQSAFCEGETITLSANTDKGTSYVWLKDGSEVSNATSGSLQISEGGAYQVRITDANTCFTTSAVFNVTRKPLPVAVITPASSPEFCAGGSVGLNASAASGNTYKWFKDGGSTPVGTSASFTANTSGAYTVEVTNNGCSKLSDAVNVLVNPMPTATITPTGPTSFCKGNSVNLVAPDAPAGQVYNYQWFRDGSTTAIGTNQSLEVLESGNYTLRVTTDKGCSTTSAALTVKVRTEAEATITYVGSTEFCDGGAIEFKAPLAPAGQQYTYQWFKEGSVTLLSTASIYTATTSGNYFVIVSNVDTDAALVCSKTSDAIAVTVSPQPIAVITGSNQDLCIGANNATTFTIAGDYSGGTPQWISSNSSFVIQNPSFNNGKATATVVATGTGSVTITLQTSNAITACNTATSSTTLTVNPLPETTVTAASTTTFCQGGSVLLSAPEGPYSYQWLRNGTAVTGGTERQFSATTAGDYTVRVTNTGTNCAATTATATTVTVNPQPIVTAASATQASQCVGANNSTVFDLTGAVTNGTPTWGVVGTTGTASVSNFSSPNATNTQVTVAGIGTVTVRLTSSSDVASCNDAFRDMTLTVKPFPIANAGPDMELCIGNNNVNGNTTRFERQASGSEGTVAWTVKSTDEGVTVTNLAYPFLMNSFVDITGVGSAVLTMTITKDGCSTSDDVTFTVKPRPSVSTIENKTYCNGTPGEAIAFGSSLSGSTFAWTSSTDVGFGTSGAGYIPAYTAINTGTAPVTTTVRVKATSNGCEGAELSFTITVNPSPKLSSTLTPPAVCSGAVFNYTPTSATVGSTFTWTRATVAGISNAPASGSGVISETLINTTTAPVKVTYVYTTTANDCSGSTQSVEVIINPLPVLSSTLTPAAICSGTAFSYTPTSATAGATFSWTRVAVAGINNGLGATGGGAINQVLTNTTTAPIDVTYQFTSTASGCSGSTQNVVVRVNPTPVLSSTLTPEAICSGATFSYTPTSATDGATYGWTRLAATGITSTGATSGTGPVSQVLTNTTASPVNVTYRFTTTANGCSSTTQDVVVKVNPMPVLSTTLTPTAICSGGPFSYTATTATTGTTLSWTRTTPTGITTTAPANGTGNISSHILTNTTANTINVTYVYTLSANGCTNTQNVVVAVKPLPNPSFTTSKDGQTIYSGGGSVQLIPITSGGTFSGTGVTGTTFNPCSIFASEPRSVLSKTVPITYTVTVNGCTSTITKNITVQRSIYKVIVVANPHPFCQGQNVNYKSYVYRDAEIIYPYLTNAYGEPVDANGNLIAKGAGNFPVANPNYPFPAGTPQILKEQAFRYFQPIVVSGTPMDINLFTYQWTKNEDQNRKNDLWQTDDAGLSSQDYYGVKVIGKFCDATLTDQMSYRMYSADLPDYEVNLAVSPTPMCQSGPVTLTATLDGDFDYWAIADLKLQFILTRGSTTYVLNTLPYNGTNTVQFTYDPAGTPIGSFIDGDKIHINFTSDVDDAISNTKCAGKTVSNTVTIVVEQPATVTTDLTAAPIVKCEGETASFAVSGTGTGLTFNWFKDGTAVPAGGRVTINNTTSNNITTSTLTITGLLASDAGMYYADLVNTGTSACKVTATTTKQQLVVNLVPDAQTMLGGDYCPYVADGVNLTLQGSEAGMTYELLKDGASLNPKIIMTGTGGALDFGVYPEGNYTIAGTGVDNGFGTCSNPTVATATITSTLVNPGIVGDLAFEWLDVNTWKVTASETGLPDASLSFGDNPEFVWYAKDIGGQQSDWVKIEDSGLQYRVADNYIILINTPPNTEIKAEVYSTTKCQMITMIVEGAVIPFPVELIEFKATKKGNNVELYWATAMEKDNTGFEIQVSENGIDYRKLDFVPTKNSNSSIKLTYTYTDAERNKRLTRYYRLKQIDTDGTAEVFGPVSVNFGEFGESINAYPNPFETDINLDIETDVAGPMEIMISDVTGKRILSKVIDVQVGKNTYTIKMEQSTPAGAYILTTRKGDQVEHIKLIRQ